MTAQIHPGLTWLEYSALPGVGSGSLRDLIMGSPLLYRHRQRHPRKETPALRFGQVGHIAVLEPDRYDEEYAVRPDGIDKKTRVGKLACAAFVDPGRVLAEYAIKPDGINRKTKAGKLEWAAFAERAGDRIIVTAAEHAEAMALVAGHEPAGGRTVITAKDHHLATGMRDEIRSHPKAGPLLAEQDGRAELSITWTDKRTGIDLRVRIDWLCSALVEFKTTGRGIGPRRFSTTVGDYGYHIQAALYHDGAYKAGLGILPVKYIVAESLPPHDVAVYTVPDAVIDVGRDRYEAALDLLAECRATDTWPGAYQEEQVLHLPAWAVEDDDEPITMDGVAMY